MGSSYEGFHDMFTDHIKMFEFKHGQELNVLQDIQSFIEKKCKLESQYSKVSPQSKPLFVMSINVIVFFLIF